MHRSVEIIKQPRLRLIESVSNLSTEQLNKVPEGFNNNIIWNLAHMVAAQQGVCYRRSGLDLVVAETFFDSYKPGTKPEQFVDADEITAIKEQLISTLDKFETDIDKGIFSNYTQVVTRYGVELRNIDDAISFLPFHDGLHIGYVMALRRLL